MSQISLRTPADLLAAAPCLLGFIPTNSLVIYLYQRTEGGTIGIYCAMRLDLTATIEQIAQLPTHDVLSDGVVAATVIAICDHHDDDHVSSLMDAVRDVLQASGIRVLHRLYTRNVTEAGQWLDIDTGNYGQTYPYTDGQATAEFVLNEGKQIRSSRQDITADFGYLPAAPQIDIADHDELAANAQAEIAAILQGATPITSPTLAARAGIAITGHPAVRDAMIGLAVDHPASAADLWTHISRRLRGRPRAEALTVAAACLCLDRDTIRAGIAVQAALAEAESTGTPRPGLANLLEVALNSGINPAKIRDVLITSTAGQPRRAH
ncbi:DUF4192 domain-containing protein [Mycobacterium sp. TY815]|uniref:DUF4192 domain-containing protein n=1 Tax=unclassified Mycobacterium TaxID=2642494 RepID=UPI0027403948|nr:DUF4192 domain-containing protein [Mycobacterium sp. TY815]MDP7706911.1 DUF4192 domain-containing protein [Mycobacterium sp. TY815]